MREMEKRKKTREQKQSMFYNQYARVRRLKPTQLQINKMQNEFNVYTSRNNSISAQYTNA